MKELQHGSRRSFLRLSGLAVASAGLVGCANPTPTSSTMPPAAASASPTALPTETPVTSPEQALARLVEGNARFVEHRTLPINESPERRVQLAQGQTPFVTILCCVDSRVPPELVFDRGLGDLFVVRSAGEVLDRAVIGSVEYGVEHVHTPLLVVMGHARCGALTAAVEAVEKGEHADGDIQYLLEQLRPAVAASTGEGEAKIESAIAQQVQLDIETLGKRPIIKHLVDAGKLKVIGATYDLATGKVALAT